MKALWTAISIVALAHLFALIGFLGWLKMSDRLDAARIHDVRELFTKTLTQVKAEQADAAAAAEVQKQKDIVEAKKNTLPMSASEKLDIRLAQSRADDIRADTAKRDLEILRDTIARERQRLDDDRKEFEQSKVAWAKQRETEQAAQQSEQFKKTLATLEALKPDKAKSTLQELLAKNQKDQVVAYLDAMQERTRTKLIDEFVKSDPKLAADLLERLRTRGQIARAP